MFVRGGVYRIIAEEPAREMPLVAGLEFDVSQPGVGPGDPEDLVGLGRDRRIDLANKIARPAFFYLQRPGILSRVISISRG